MENPPKKFFRLSPGREVRLRYAYFVTCREAVKDAAGEVVELRCTYDPATRGGNAPDGRKVQATIALGRRPTIAMPAEMRVYNPLFTRPDPGAGGDVFADLNPQLARSARRSAGSSRRWPRPRPARRCSSSARAISAATRRHGRRARLQPHGRLARQLGQGEGGRVRAGRANSPHASNWKSSA